MTEFVEAKSLDQILKRYEERIAMLERQWEAAHATLLVILKSLDDQRAINNALMTRLEKLEGR